MKAIANRAAERGGQSWRHTPAQQPFVLTLTPDRRVGADRFRAGGGARGISRSAFAPTGRDRVRRAAQEDQNFGGEDAGANQQAQNQERETDRGARAEASPEKAHKEFLARWDVERQAT